MYSFPETRTTQERMGGLFLTHVLYSRWGQKVNNNKLRVSVVLFKPGAFGYKEYLI